MGYFKEATYEQVTLPSDPTYWVKVRTTLKYGETKQFVTARDEEGNLNRIAASDAFLLAVIAEWNLDNEAGEILPITAENINALDDKDAAAIIQAAGAKVGGDSEKKS